MSIKPTKKKSKSTFTDPYAVTWGADPELMIYDLELGRMASAIRVLGNDKTKPIDLGDGLKLYADNVLCEFSFPPVNEQFSLNHAIGSSLQKIQDWLGPRYRLVATAAHEFHEDELKCDQAWDIGCTPNFDARKGLVEGKPVPNEMVAGFGSRIRTGSFHLHIGAEALIPMEAKLQAVKLLDGFLGLPSIIFDPDPTSKTRRELYGKASEFRPTPYGLEYRVLGNYVLRSPILLGNAVTLAYSALQRLFDPFGLGLDMGKVCEELAPTIINNHNYKEAFDTVECYFPGPLEGMITTQSEPPDLYRDWGIKINPKTT